MTAPLPVVVRLTGPDRDRSMPWPAGWPIPREGEHVVLPGSFETLHVLALSWCPLGDDDGHPYPCIVLVVGPYKKVRRL